MKAETGALAKEASWWIKHNFLLPHHKLEHLQPCMLVQGKHPHISLFSRGQPMTGKEDNEGGKKKKAGPVSKDQFCKKCTVVISWVVEQISWPQPPVHPPPDYALFSAQLIFKDQPTHPLVKQPCWENMRLRVHLSWGSLHQ